MGLVDYVKKLLRVHDNKVLKALFANELPVLVIVDGHIRVSPRLQEYSEALEKIKFKHTAISGQIKCGNRALLVRSISEPREVLMGMRLSKVFFADGLLDTIDIRQLGWLERQTELGIEAL